MVRVAKTSRRWKAALPLPSKNFEAKALEIDRTEANFTESMLCLRCVKLSQQLVMECLDSILPGRFGWDAVIIQSWIIEKRLGKGKQNLARSAIAEISGFFQWTFNHAGVAEKQLRNLPSKWRKSPKNCGNCRTRFGCFECRNFCCFRGLWYIGTCRFPLMWPRLLLSTPWFRAAPLCVRWGLWRHALPDMMLCSPLMRKTPFSSSCRSKTQLTRCSSCFDSLRAARTALQVVYDFGPNAKFFSHHFWDEGNCQTVQILRVT